MEVPRGSNVLRSHAPGDPTIQTSEVEKLQVDCPIVGPDFPSTVSVGVTCDLSPESERVFRPVSNRLRRPGRP